MNWKTPVAGLLLGATLVACSSNEDEKTDVDDGSITVSTDITSDTTWTKDKVYTLKKHVFVKDGATLTIEPGTTVKGLRGSSLVVATSGKIHAAGTAAEPIVFTSSMPEGNRYPGDWGGVVLLGLARINVSQGWAQIEGFPSGTPATTYGGDDDAHDCGTMRYARIEFAGFQLAPDNELNGLTVGGCGSQTKLEYIQVHKGADDGIEFFGGTADVKHAVITQPDDDGLDWDYGWTGRVQFLVVQQNNIVGDKGIEADNNGAANNNEPRSKPLVYNISLIGSNLDGAGKTGQGGIHFRRGTAGHVYNAIVTGFKSTVIDVDGSASVAQFDASDLFLKNSLIYANAGITDATTAWPDSGCSSTQPLCNDGGFDEAEKFFAEALANVAVDPQLADPSNLAAPNFLPAVGSPALTGGATPPDDGFFDASATFKGAFGSTDWTSGWTAFPAN